MVAPSWEPADFVVKHQITVGGVHAWPFDLSFPVDVRFFSLNQSYDVPIHQANQCEVVYIQSGEMVFQIPGSNCVLKKGDLLLINPGSFHRIRSTDCSAPEVREAVLFFSPELIRSACLAGGDVQCYLIPFTINDPSSAQVVTSQTGLPAKIGDLICQINEELPATSLRARLAVKTYVKMILMLLVNYYSESRQTKEVFANAQRNVEQLRPLFEFLDKHCGHPIRAEDGARVMGMSKWQFNRFLNMVTGHSFISYLNLFRIAKAQSLLASTDTPISQVSLEVGFCDQSYFGVVFRRLVGMTPFQFRRGHFTDLRYVLARNICPEQWPQYPLLT
jgi:AraC family transcriptional activator of pobA